MIIGSQDLLPRSAQAYFASAVVDMNGDFLGMIRSEIPKAGRMSIHRSDHVPRPIYIIV